MGQESGLCPTLSCINLAANASSCCRVADNGYLPTRLRLTCSLWPDEALDVAGSTVLCQSTVNTSGWREVYMSSRPRFWLQTALPLSAD